MSSAVTIVWDDSDTAATFLRIIEPLAAVPGLGADGQRRISVLLGEARCAWTCSDGREAGEPYPAGWRAGLLLLASEMDRQRARHGDRSIAGGVYGDAAEAARELAKLPQLAALADEPR